MYMRVEHENIESNGRTSASGLEEEDYHQRGQSLLTVVDDSLKYRQSSGGTSPSKITFAEIFGSP